MAKAINARRQGDEFQAIFFWEQLVSLLVGDRVKRVTFESDQRIFVDDVVVEYSEPLIDDQTGQQYVIDAYQCKYHVAKNLMFTAEKLIDPKFIKNNQSMLQRLYEAYKKYSEDGELFRLHIVSSSSWETQDPFYRFVSSENYVRSSFYEKGVNSAQGKIRIKFANHLGIPETELKPFLDKVRFDLRINRKALAQSLDTKLHSAGLLPLDLTITNSRYSELAWKWFEQGTNYFDRQKLSDLVRKEKLIDIQRKSLLLIRHQSLDPLLPEAVCDDLPDHLRSLKFTETVIDLTHLFSDGRLVDTWMAINEQQEKTSEIQHLCKTSANLELAYYGIAHIPLIFLLGYQLNIRKPINIFEHNRQNNKWDLLQSANSYPDLILKKPANNIGTDAVIKFGISYPIPDADVTQVVTSSKLIVDLALPTPTPDAVRNIDQLENYARNFRGVLDDIHNIYPDVGRIHIFFAGPVSLAFRCGQMISPTIHPKVLVYNYFSRDEPKYKWGICINAPINSPDFLFQL
jgi:hypothetical protein